MEKVIKGILVVCLLIGMVGFAGCKKDEPVEDTVIEVPEEAVEKGEEKVSDAEEEMAKMLELISKMSEQTKCPVMGGDIDKNIFATYKDKKVYFCCQACVAKFEADPEAYIGKLPQFQK